MIDDQLTAETPLSSLPMPLSGSLTELGMMPCPRTRSMPEKGEKNDDGDRHAEQPKQNSTTHGGKLLP
jgi:hypothetical protein